jgi:hypothetical protein
MIGLRLFGFNKLHRMILRADPVSREGSADADHYLAYAARMIRAAAAYSPVHATCLDRSLALQWLLCLHHIDTDLRIGVAAEAGKFSAHAWVEYRGSVLNDSLDVADRFLPFAGSLELSALDG